jgi:hypothetical protein
MPWYMCGNDGPLGGQVFEWDRMAEPGETVTFCLVDVAYEVPDGGPEADYRVVSLPAGRLPGRLEFVADRGMGAWPGAVNPRAVA